MTYHGSFVGKIYLSFRALRKLKLQSGWVDEGLSRLRLLALLFFSGSRSTHIHTILWYLAGDGWSTEPVRDNWLFPVVAHLSFHMPAIHYYFVVLLAFISRR